MKLAYIANIRLPTEKAHGIQIMSMAEAFAKTGTEVTLIVPSRKTSIVENPFSFYGIAELFSIERIRVFDLTHYGIVLRALAYHLERLSFGKRVLKYIRNHAFDYYYTRDELTFLLLALRKYPVAYEMHAMPRKLFLYRNAFLSAKKIIVITEHLKKALLHAGVPEEKIFVAADGVDVGKFTINTTKSEAREKAGLPQRSFIALYAGLLDEWKGFRTVLESAAELKRNGVTTVIVGGKNEKVKKLTKEYPDAIFLGFRKYSELPVIQRAADVLLIPNSAQFVIGRLYTSPLKLFTSMASGVPIIASDLPSLREVISEETAVFFQPDSAVSLLEAILKIKNEPILGEKLAQAAKEKVKNYSWENRARKILRVLQP